jgi:hypothetical protein
MTLTTSGLLALMLSLSPPEPITALSLASENHETLQARVARYESIAADVLAVAYADDVAPVLGDRARTALLLLATTYWESDGWHWAVDSGARRGDGGASWCIAQVHLPGRKTTPEGWTGEALVQDRRRCLRAALRVLRASLVQCVARPRPERLAAYVSGSCDVAVATSRRRWRTFERLVREVEAAARAS